MYFAYLYINNRYTNGKSKLISTCDIIIEDDKTIQYNWGIKYDIKYDANHHKICNQIMIFTS